MPASVVHLILQEHDLHPHRLRTFNFSSDPKFEDKLLDFVELYMNAPENAVVLCMNEKAGIKALRVTPDDLIEKVGTEISISFGYR